MDDSLAQLARRIRSGIAIEFSEHEEQELYYDLERHRPRLLQLLSVGPRSPDEAKDVEKRKYTVNGKQLELNADLVRPVLFIAEQLDCSEYYCADLFTRVERRYPNLDVSQLVEKAIEVFHGDRSALLYCLVAIFESSTDPNYASLSLGVVLRKFTRELVGTMLSLGRGRRGRLPERIIQEIDRSIETSAKLSQLILDATSNTTPVGGQGTARLSHDALQMRLNCLRVERRQLGYLLFIISALHYLTGTEILKLFERLAQKPNDDMVHYILASALSALDVPDSDSLNNHIHSDQPLYKDLTFVSSISKLLDAKSSWNSPRLRAVLNLKWSLFLWSAFHQDAEFSETSVPAPDFSDGEIEKRVWDAVQSDVFPFLSEMTHIVRPRGAVEDADTPLTGSGVKIVTDGKMEPDVVDEDFKILVLRSYESLVVTFIASMSAVIRRIKHRQEDVGLAASRSARHGAGDMPPVPVVPRNDIAEFFEFIGVLYMCLPPDEGLKFWVASTEPGEGKLFAFVRWATESRDRSMISATCHMLAGIANGRSSAEVAYNFLATSHSADGGHGGMLSGGGNVFSWATLFSALTWWAETLPNPQAQHQQQLRHQELNLSGRWQQQPGLSDSEALMVGAFLRLLRVVVKHAPAARIALYSMPDFRVIPTLLVLLQHSIQLEVKGMILDALAAFCEPGAGVQGVEICKNVWAALERAELINLRSGGGIATRGIENELEGVETPAQRYPATIPFLRLLNSLIHTPKCQSPQQSLVDYEPLETIPDGLGQPSRLGGIAPYVRFVVDTVLLRARNREYLDPSDKWRMIDGSLGFIERCLASYNLRSLLSLGEDAVIKNPELLRSYQVHPGFDLLLQFLTDSPLRAEIVEYIAQGVDALETGTIKNAYFERVLLRVLRIVQCILESQDLLVELLLPLLAQIDSSGNAKFLSSAIVPFDQFLNWSSSLIVKIASCTLHAETAETKLLAIKIITLLSESPVFAAMDQVIQNFKGRFNRLAVILDKDQDSNIISDGFVVLLQQDLTEDTEVSPEIVEMSTGAGARMTPCRLELGHSIRLAILQLFLQNTTPDKPAPNIAHSLLGFYPDPSHPDQLAVQDPHATGSRKTCLHVVLELLNAGVPRAAAAAAAHGDWSHGGPTFFITHPMLAERCYRLVYQLCSHSTTSMVTMRYLRTREDFFARHLSVLPLRAPQSVHGVTGQVVYGDNTRVSINSVALTCFLRVRAWVLDLTALELHVLTEMGQAQRASRLLGLLFGSAAEAYDERVPVNTLLQPLASGQTLIRIVELFHSFDLEWSDGITVDQEMKLQLFGPPLDLSGCLRADETGCEIFDVDALLQLMGQHRRQLQVQGTISNPQIQEQLRNETRYILTSCTVENNRREIYHAKSVGFESWKKLLDICLVKGFHRLPQDRRESILFDLLQTLPRAIQSSLTPQSTAIQLSESMLSLVTKLRDDRQQQLILQSSFDDTYSSTLPTDRLLVLLKNILECLASSGKAELIRGNLYAALVNYLHLVEAARESKEMNDFGAERDLSMSQQSFSVQSGSISEEVTFNAGDAPFAVRRMHERRSELDVRTLAVINKHVDGLVSITSTDAIDGTEVWKTVSFILLDSLVGLSRLERSHRVLTILSRKGYLHNFVQSMKDSDFELQQVLRPDPESLNSLYVYEAKMSLLIRVAQTQLGAEKLLDSRLYSVLAQCDFMDARPEADQSFLDKDSFLPSAVHRYHQLVFPALELANSVVATLGASSQASKQALGFILAHRETFLILLRDNTPTPSLAEIREMHLLVSLCSNVVPSIDQGDLRAPASGFGGVHAAILSLAAKTVFKGVQFYAVSPVNDTERHEATVKAPGYGHNRSIFDTKLNEAMDLLVEAIWGYLEIASGSDANREFTPVLTPISVTSQRDGPSSQINAPAPTISDSIEALEQCVSDLAQVLSEVMDITAKLATKDTLGLEEVEDIARSSGAEYADDLDPMQRRLLAYKELEKARQNGINKVLRRLHTLDVLLLLIWRHVHHYSASPDLQSQLKSGVSTTSTGRSGPSPFGNISSNPLLEHVGRSLRPTLERIEGLQLPQEVVGHDYRSREGYIELMCRLIIKTVVEGPNVASVESALDAVDGLGSW